MFKLVSPRLWLALLWAILVATSLALRPLFPIDETRYVAVAWDMWVRNDFLVPHLNGETYSHKPPLLFWLMQLSWVLFGVNDWSHRFIAPLFSLATLFLVQSVAKELWPDRKQIAELVPFILLGFFFWMVFSTLTMFDIMLSFFVLVAIYSQLRLIRYGLSLKRWALLGLAIGGGVLTKGPVILLHILPLALLVPWWIGEHKQFRWQQWYVGLVLAVLMGAAIALCWAIPAGIVGGEAYQKAIFLGQTSGRIVDSFAHKLPFWWYLRLLPLMLLPWPLMKSFWFGLAKLDVRDFGIRFCMAWLLPVFMAFSLVSGKRIHYLLPIIPALALMLAWMFIQLADLNWRRFHLHIMSLLVVIGMILLLLPWLNSHFHWRAEISMLSPVWGVILCGCAGILAMLSANTIQGSVSYVCVASIATALVLASAFFAVQGDRYDTAPPARKIAAILSENKSVGFYGNKYHGQFHFTGRLTQPLALIRNHNDLTAFINQNPEGYVLVEYQHAKDLPDSSLAFHYPFKSHNVGFISCKMLLDMPKLRSKLKQLS